MEYNHIREVKAINERLTEEKRIALELENRFAMQLLDIKSSQERELQGIRNMLKDLKS